MYDDQILELEKSFYCKTSSSDVGVLPADARYCFYELFGKITADNQIREDRIISCIEVVAKEDEEGQEKMKE